METSLEPVKMEPKIIENKNKFVWNFSEIKTSLSDYIEKYTGLVVTETNLHDMESAQKEVASVRIKIDSFRKEVKKKLEEPYKQFEIEIKELQSLVEQAEKPLKDQILKYENARIVKLESELLLFAEKSANSLGVRPEYFGKFAIQSDWTKRTAKLPATKKSIITVIEDMLSRQQHDDESVKLQRERVEMIAGLCAVHSQTAGLKTAVVPEDINHLVADVSLPEISNIIIQVCHDRKNVENRAAIQEPVIVSQPAITEPVITEPTYSGPPPMPPQFNSVPDPQMGTVLQSGPPLPPAHPGFVAVPPPPMPPVMPAMWDVTLRLPEITILQASGFKGYLEQSGIKYEVVSQEPRRTV